MRGLMWALALSAVATATLSSSSAGGPNCTLHQDTDYFGDDAVPGIHNVTSPGACCELCQKLDNCSVFTWLNEPPSYGNYCSLKTAGAASSRRSAPGHVSGCRLPPRPNRPGVFFRVPWASEVHKQQLDAWFGLVAQGRAEGPGSPYYVSELGLQQVASGQWPIVNATNPGVLFERELELIAPYFHLFDRVYVGTLLLPGKNYSNYTYWVDYAAKQQEVARKFLKLYPLEKYPNLAWYITEEGCLEDPSDLTPLVHLSAPALHEVANLPILWSPGFCRKFDTLPGDPPGSVLEANLETMFCSDNLMVPVAVHFQDLCGQTSTFEFPMTFNYEGAMNSTDGVSYYHLLQRVSAKCPKLREVKVNAEHFIEHRNPEGQGGEDHGAFILDGDPREVGNRRAVYVAEADLGVCWALPHWFDLNTFANRTMDFQCTEQQIKGGTCTHPYRATHVSELSSRYTDGM